MNAAEDKINIDLTNGRVISGVICAGFVPVIFFITISLIEPHDVYTFNYIMSAIFSMVPGFLSIFIPCFALLWFGKTKPGWFATVPAIIIVPQLLIFNPSQGYIRVGPTTAMIAMAIAAFSGLLCWFISVRMDSRFKPD